MDVRGRRVTVMGLGRHGGGAAAARWLVERGAEVVVTDLAEEAALADSLEALHGLPIVRYRLGGHCERDFLDAELVVVNPAVKPGNRFVALAAAAGAKISSEIEIFLNACPAHLCGVTGSNGKSTTAAMTAAILEADGRRVWLGGNIGVSLLGELKRMTAEDWVVLELSSFQLAQLAPQTRLPETAIITNCTPNHLDWHASWRHYVAAKQRLLIEQPRSGAAALNLCDREVAAWAPLVRGRLVEPWADHRLPPLKIPGLHNLRNAACAAAAAADCGCTPEAIQRGLAEFAGLPHRLEPVGEARGRNFFNDSMATTPESTIAAVDALGSDAWFLVGGYDKGVDYRELIERLADGARGVAFFGAVREKLAGLISSIDAGARFQSCETLEEAVEWCFRQSRRGDSIVLSPACASYDQFRDYRHRAAVFVEVVRSFAARCDP